MTPQESCELPASRVSDEEVAALLARAKTIAVVGLSKDPSKPSHRVPQYLQSQGYRIIPVNPTAQGELLGERVYASLRDVPGPVDIVDIFRLPQDVPPIVEDAIAIKAKAVWMQEGIVHNAAADRARRAGLAVVMDRCMLKVHQASRQAASQRVQRRVAEHHGISVGGSAVRHRLRDAVFGTQDGLLSTMGALTGIAAGTQNREAVVIAGCVIVAVESLSMAAGSYLSSKSQREYLERLLKEEEEEIARDPEGERKELFDMYRARGFEDAEIEIIAKRLLSDPRLLLEDMAHKELGISPQALEEPFGSAVVMGVSYVMGGFVPVLPYFFLPIPSAMPISIGGTLLCLFLFGGLKGRIVKQVWWKSGLEMLSIAGVAALVGFWIGRVADRWITR